RAGTGRLTERYVKMSKYPRVDRCLGHHVAAGRVVTFLRIHSFDFGAVATDADLSSSGDIVRTGHIRHAIELKLVASGSHRITDVHVNVFLRLVSSDERDAHNEHRHAEMRDLHGVVAAGLGAEFLERGELSGGYSHAFPEIHGDRGHDPDCQ